MVQFDIWNGVLFLVYAVLICVPASRILKRTGHSGWWALLLLIPLVNLLVYWVFAYKKWPVEAASAPAPAAPAPLAPAKAEPSSVNL